MLNCSNTDISRDGRLTVLLFLLCGILLYDLDSLTLQTPVNDGSDNFACAQLRISGENDLVIAGCSDQRREQNNQPIPDEYTPLFFALIPINTAHRDLLMTASGVGPVLADSIVAYRKRFGPFTNSMDLCNLSGVGPKRAAKLAAAFSFTEVP